MLRALTFSAALALLPAVAGAQQPCTSDASKVVDDLYRTILERSVDRSADTYVQQLSSGSTVRELVRQIAKSPEHVQRFAQTGGQGKNEQAVAYLYRHVLGRQADQGGLKAHTDGLALAGVGGTVDSLVNSEEYRRQFGEWQVPGTGLRYCGNAAASNNATPRRFRNMDTNGDSIVTRSEWRGPAEAFEASDWNRDGVLSGDEVRPGAVRRPYTFGRSETPVGTSGVAAMTNEAFDSLDRNRNGRLERNEWNGTRATFDQLDTNQNNILSRAEVVSVNAEGTSEFTGLDLNRDGRLSIDEWNWNRRTFDQQDANRDGVISPSEFTGAPRNPTVR